MTQSNHQATEESKTGEEGGVLFPAGEQTTMAAKPGDGSFDDPASTIPAQRTSILGSCVGPTIGTVRRDHLDAQLGESFIQRIAVVSLVADQTLGVKFGLSESEGLLHHGDLSNTGRVQREAKRKSMGVNHYLQFRSLALTGETHGRTPAFGGGKSGVHKALFQVDAPVFNKLSNDLCKQSSKGFRLAPQLQVVVHRRLGRKGLRQILPLNAGMQNKKGSPQRPLSHPHAVVPSCPSCEVPKSAAIPSTARR